MPKDMDALWDEFKSDFEDFKETNDQRLDEMQKKGTVDPILEEKLDKIQSNLDKNEKALDEMSVAMETKETTVYIDENGDEIDMEAKAAEFSEQCLGGKKSFDAAGLAEYKGIFNDYLKNGDEVMGAEELKTLRVGSDPDGGYTVHPDMTGRIVKKVFETSPMRREASIQAISTDALEGLFDLDEAASGWVGEEQPRGETDTPKLNKWRIPVHEIFAQPKITQKLLDDSAVNIQQWLADKVADKFAREEATAFVTGDGQLKPRGFLTYPAGTQLPGQIEQIKTGVNGDFPAAPDGGDVLITALYSLKAAYRGNTKWFMNRSTTAAVRKLKDGDGNYLWQPGLQAGEPARILGYATVAFEDMPDIANGSLSIAVGDMRQTYQIVERMGMRVLRDPYTAKPYVLFYSTRRVGGDVVNFESLKLIDFSA